MGEYLIDGRGSGNVAGVNQKNRLMVDASGTMNVNTLGSTLVYQGTASDLNVLETNSGDIKTAVEKIDDLQGALKSQDTDELISRITNSSGVEINPATEGNQDTIISNQTNNTQKTQITDGTNDVSIAQKANGNYVLNVHNEEVNFTQFNHNFIREVGASTTLASEAVKGATSISVVSAAGFAVGELIEIHSSATHIHQFYKITNIVTTTFTLDRPLKQTHASGSNVDETAINMATVAGSLASPITFELVAQPGEIIILTRFLISITDNTAADDSKFGGGGALTNGVYIRVSRNSGSDNFEDVTIWRSNADMKGDMGVDLTYSDKAGAGNFGVNGRWTLTASNFAIKLIGDNNDKLECLIQDDLTSLISFNIKSQGHFE